MTDPRSRRRDARRRALLPRWFGWLQVLTLVGGVLAPIVAAAVLAQVTGTQICGRTTPCSDGATLTRSIVISLGVLAVILVVLVLGFGVLGGWERRLVEREQERRREQRRGPRGRTARRGR